MNGSSDYVRFSPAPLSGYAIGPITMACLFKRSATGSSDTLIGLGNSGLSLWRAEMVLTAGNDLNFVSNLTSSGGGLSPLPTSTSAWYLAVQTWAGTGNIAKSHLYNGTSWQHPTGATSLTGSQTVAGTDVLTVSSTIGALALPADVVCAGIKKSDSSNAQVETLSMSLFSAWLAFGFDWLIGFDTSLQSAGVLQDQAAAGTGDETAKSGTSVVADPPGWAWTGTGATPNSGFLGFM